MPRTALSLVMPRLCATPISLAHEEELELQRLARARRTPRDLAERAEMILRSAAGTELREIANAGQARQYVTAGYVDVGAQGSAVAQICAIQHGLFRDQVVGDWAKAGSESDTRALQFINARFATPGRVRGLTPEFFDFACS